MFFLDFRFFVGLDISRRFAFDFRLFVNSTFFLDFRFFVGLDISRRFAFDFRLFVNSTFFLDFRFLTDFRLFLDLRLLLNPRLLIGFRRFIYFKFLFCTFSIHTFHIGLFRFLNTHINIIRYNNRLHSRIFEINFDSE